MPSKNPSKKALPLKNLLRPLLRSVRLHDPLGVRPTKMRFGDPKSPHQAKTGKFRETQRFLLKNVIVPRRKDDPGNSKKFLLGIPNGHFGMRMAKVDNLGTGEQYAFFCTIRGHFETINLGEKMQAPNWSKANYLLTILHEEDRWRITNSETSFPCGQHENFTCANSPCIWTVLSQEFFLFACFARAQVPRFRLMLSVKDMRTFAGLRCLSEDED